MALNSTRYRTLGEVLPTRRANTETPRSKLEGNRGSKMAVQLATRLSTHNSKSVRRQSRVRRT
jgi:hypothetical protein